MRKIFGLMRGAKTEATRKKKLRINWKKTEFLNFFDNDITEKYHFYLLCLVMILFHLNNI